MGAFCTQPESLISLIKHLFVEIQDLVNHVLSTPRAFCGMGLVVEVECYPTLQLRLITIRVLSLLNSGQILVVFNRLQLGLRRRNETQLRIK